MMLDSRTVTTFLTLAPPLSPVSSPHGVQLPSRPRQRVKRKTSMVFDVKMSDDHVYVVVDDEVSWMVPQAGEGDTVSYKQFQKVQSTGGCWNGSCGKFADQLVFCVETRLSFSFGSHPAQTVVGFSRSADGGRRVWFQYGVVGRSVPHPVRAPSPHAASFVSVIGSPPPYHAAVFSGRGSRPSFTECVRRFAAKVGRPRLLPAPPPPPPANLNPDLARRRVLPTLP